jgi:hypothetical protein
MNPANTLPYSALGALEHSSVIHIVEVLLDEHNVHPLNVQLRGLDALKLHRDALSHPVTVRWRSPKKQAFFEDHRQWSDFRPALVWDLQRSINEQLRARGLKTFNDDIPVTWAMAEMLNLILRLSVNDGPSVPSVPAVSELMTWLGSAKDKYLRDFEAYPDGRLPKRNRRKQRAQG